jgi:hypothetical protein
MYDDAVSVKSPTLTVLRLKSCPTVRSRCLTIRAIRLASAYSSQKWQTQSCTHEIKLYRSKNFMKFMVTVSIVLVIQYCSINSESG